MCKKRKKNKKKMKKLIQFLKPHISGTLVAILLKYGMWSTEVEGSVHSKSCLVSSRQHRAMEVQKLCFLSSCQYIHGCCTPASWADLSADWESTEHKVKHVLQFGGATQYC